MTWRLVLALCAALALVPAGAQPLTDLDQVDAALDAGRYDDVEALYARLRQSRARTPEGLFVYERFTWHAYWSSSSQPEDPSYWPKVDAASKAWLEHSPRSHVAAMTRAFAMAYRAGYVQAREKDWKQADRLAAEAWRIMEASREEGSKDPVWHAALLRVASVEALPRTDVLALIHAAAAVDPAVMRIWLEASIALSPDGRNAEDVVWLMKLALRNAKSSEGISIYARVLHTIYWRYGDFRASPFQRTGLDWTLLNDSFLDWKRRYPKGYPAALHAALACAAGDRETTRRVLPRDGSDDTVFKSFGGENYRAICKEWAEGGAEKPRV